MKLTNVEAPWLGERPIMPQLCSAMHSNATRWAVNSARDRGINQASPTRPPLVRLSNVMLSLWSA